MPGRDSAELQALAEAQKMDHQKQIEKEIDLTKKFYELSNEVVADIGNTENKVVAKKQLAVVEENFHVKLERT